MMKVLFELFGIEVDIDDFGEFVQNFGFGVIGVIFMMVVVGVGVYLYNIVWQKVGVIDDDVNILGV